MSSASRPSASVVNPTRSAKRMETSRRSATGASAEVEGPGWKGAVVEGRGPATSGVAHSPQNFAVAEFVVPQAGQTAARRPPHSPQNLRPASFSVPQLEQINPIALSKRNVPESVSESQSHGSANLVGVHHSSTFGRAALSQGLGDDGGGALPSANPAVLRTEAEVERETGFEPATFCLGSRHSAS